MEVTQSALPTYSDVVRNMWDRIRGFDIVPRTLFPDDTEADGAADAGSNVIFASIGRSVGIRAVEQLPPAKPTHVSRCTTKEKSTKKPTKKSTKKPKEIENCAMCFEKMEKPSECTKLPCGHTFHTNCISQLRESSIDNKCPLCRIQLPPGTLEEEVYEHQRKCYKHNEKVYTGSHCVVLHSRIIYKKSEKESNIWCTFPWEYNGNVKVKTKHKNPIQKSRKSNKKYKNFKNRV